MAGKNTSVWAAIVCFALGALLSAAVMHRSAVREERALRTVIETKTAENIELNKRVEDAEAAQEEAEAAADSARSASVDVPSERANSTTADPDIALAMQLARDRLKDPASAVFGAVRIVLGEHGKIACGMLNARNGFGGLTGMEPFTVNFDKLNAGDPTAVNLNGGADWLLYCSGLVPSA